MSLDDILKMTQVLFYLAVGSTAVLTYRSAKRGLLNAVNTEYQKRVMDRLAEISDDLVDHLDYDSSNHFIHTVPCSEVFDELIEKWKPYKSEIIEHGGIPDVINTELSPPRNVIDLFKTAERIRSDPFVPEVLRSILSNFYLDKVKILASVFGEVFDEVQVKLLQEKNWEDLESLKNQAYVDIIGRLFSEGHFNSAFEEKVHDLRNRIQNYMKQFDSITS